MACKRWSVRSRHAPPKETPEPQPQVFLFCYHSFMTDAQLVRAWIRYNEQTDPAENNSDLDAVEALDELRVVNPEKLYVLANLIAIQSDNKQVLAALGAGPVEDLLCTNGGVFVDRVLKQASTDERWRFILGCVWMSRAKNKTVQQKVEAAIREYYPNGTP